MNYKDIKEFNQRCEEHPDHQSGMISYGMISQRLQEEIDELREYIEQRTWVGLTDEEVESLQRLAIDPVDANGWGFLNRERFAYLIEIKLKEKNHD